MLYQVGEVSFDFETKDGQRIQIDAAVRFEPDGTPELDTLELWDENSKKVNFKSLEGSDREKITSHIYKETIPQDYLYNEYDDSGDAS